MCASIGMTGRADDPGAASLVLKTVFIAFTGTGRCCLVIALALVVACEAPTRSDEPEDVRRSASTRKTRTPYLERRLACR